MDNVYCYAPPADCIKFFNAFSSEAKKHGSIVNPTKSSLACFRPELLTPEIRQDLKQLAVPVLEEVVNVMGCDIFKDMTVNQAYMPDSVWEHMQMLDTLQLPCYPVQHALLLARASASTALVYTARTQLPTLLAPSARILKNATDEFLQKKLALEAKFEFSNIQKQQIELSLSNGGLGMRSLLRISQPAFVASTAAAAPFMLKTQRPATLTNQLANECWEDIAQRCLPDSGLNDLQPDSASHLDWFGQTTPDGMQLNDSTKLQKKIGTFLKAAERKVFEGLEDVDDARFRALIRPNASRFLTVIPTEPSLTLHDKEISIAVLNRLSVRQALPKAKLMKCGCGTLMTDPFHGISCNRHLGSKVIARHDAVKGAIVKWIKRSGNSAAAEPRDFSRDLDRQIRPDFQASLGASSIVGDIVVMNPAAPTHVDNDEPMKNVAIKKITKFAAFVGDELGQADEFVPAIFETFGGFSNHSVAFIAKIGKETRGEGIDSQTVMDGLTNEIAIAIQRGNANCVLSCLQAARQVAPEEAAEPAAEEKSQLL
ncbi:MAG: hypothetical protein H0U59_13765 [Gemmatimonadaceae bacterium]|nr:hypothetical protein [Gemmatimonadaceae bacterium]